MEFDAIFVNDDQLLLQYEPLENFPLLIQSLSDDRLISDPIVGQSLIINHVADLKPTRIPKTYNGYNIAPLFYELQDESGNDVVFEREVREWDLVLPFGNDNIQPRRYPIETVVKNKKIGGKF